jgi:hypothetical protein
MPQELGTATPRRDPAAGGPQAGGGRIGDLPGETFGASLHVIQQA